MRVCRPAGAEDVSDISDTGGRPEAISWRPLRGLGMGGAALADPGRCPGLF